MQTQQYTSAGTVEDIEREGLPVTSFRYKVYEKAEAIYTTCKTCKKLLDAIYTTIPQSSVVHFKTVCDNDDVFSVYD